MGYTDRYADIKSKLCELAASDSSLRAASAIGSSARENLPADEFSDLDLIIVSETPEKWYSGEYPALLGEVSVSFIEPTLGGGKERRCIYGSDRDVDMIIFTPSQFREALEQGVAGWVMNRGYRFLFDKDGFAGLAGKYVSTAAHRELIPEEEFLNTVNDFYFHNIWACKKLLRGELWSAKMCIDSYLKTRLLTIIEQYQLALGGKDVWHDGRFLDSWAEPFILEGLRSCFARYDTAECRKALLATHSLFARLASDTARLRAFGYPEKAEKCAAEYLERIK